MLHAASLSLEDLNRTSPKLYSRAGMLRAYGFLIFVSAATILIPLAFTFFRSKALFLLCYSHVVHVVYILCADSVIGEMTHVLPLSFPLFCTVLKHPN